MMSASTFPKAMIIARRPRKSAKRHATLLLLCILVCGMFRVNSALRQPESSAIVTPTNRASLPRNSAPVHTNRLPESESIRTIHPMDHDGGNKSTTTSADTSLRVIYGATFLMILATSLVALAPSQALVQLLSSQSGGSATTTAVTQTTTILSAISATAAIIEMAASHSLGRMLDRVGRKPTLLAAMGAITISHAIVAITPSYLSNGFEIIAIGIAKLIGILSIGFAVMATQTMFSDLANPSHHHHDLGRKKQHGHNIVSAAIGAQMALSGVGFLVGVMGAGQLTEWGLSCVYGVSAGLGGLAMLLVQRFLPETKINIPTNNNNNNNQSSSPSVWQSLWSCTRLLTRHGKNVRILGILLMLQTLPMFMGDFFLIFAKSEWNLSPQQISSFLALLGVNGVVANVLGGRLLQRLGIRQYTNLAILSKMISAIGASFFGYKGGMWGLAIGCLGSAQSIGIVAALVEQGSASGLPQGELAGERASLMALLKVFGPIWYSALYVQGQRRFGQSNLPFVFNIVLSLTALIISQFYLP